MPRPENAANLSAEPAAQPRLSNRAGSPQRHDRFGVLPIPAAPFLSMPIRDHFNHGAFHMNTIIAAVDRTITTIRRATGTLIERLTRKASFKLALTVNLPPLVKLTINYKADISEPENSMPERSRKGSV